MKVILASHNAHKLYEVRALFNGKGFEGGVEIVSLDAHPEVPEAPEDHDTFQANALQKARFVWKYTGGVVVADDSGIEIAALDWAPGVHSKRFTPEGTDSANNAQVLRDLDGAADRRARYRCVIAVVSEAGEATAQGVCWGEIGHGPRGEGGFGYDPLFWPVDHPGRTMAEVSLDEKNAVSHRARAFGQLPGLLEGLGVR